MRYLLFILLLITGKSGFAQKQLRMDTAFTEGRSFSNDAIKKFKGDRDFQYDNIVEPVESLWDKFWKWFWWNVNQLLNTRQGRTTLWTLFIVFGVCMIAFFVIKVTGANKAGLFGRSSRDSLDYTISSDDINNISFDEAIQQAISLGNYRMAVRMLYLQSLKKLSDKGHIQWQINKTNSDYQKEISGNKWSSLFNSLTFNFDYAWYGEMPVSKERFETVHQQFQHFNNQL